MLQRVHCFLSLLAIFPLINCSYVFFLEKRCSNGQQIGLVGRTSKNFDLLPQWKDKEWLKCCPGCFVSYHNLPEFSYPVAIFPLIHSSYVLSGRMLEWSTNLAVHCSSKFFDLWRRMVKMLHRVFYLSYLTWILISCCNFPSNSLFLCFIWRKDGQTVNKFGFMAVKQIVARLKSYRRHF